MGKSWREPSKGWTKVKGPDKRKEEARKNEKLARREIQRIARRTGERLETFMD